ncbi:MAG: helix-turn-helix domain-containing protein [Candidatus Competibacteraceae bacterium]|nr:helix-turn-helix domain-containing protein [Candidatus Competibacteraceae bacterium]
MLLTAKQAADFLHVHAETVKEWAAAGKIPGSKKTGRWLFVEADLVEYVRSGYPERWRVPQHTPGEYKCEENTGVSGRGISAN